MKIINEIKNYIKDKMDGIPDDVYDDLEVYYFDEEVEGIYIEGQASRYFKIHTYKDRDIEPDHIEGNYGDIDIDIYFSEDNIVKIEEL